MRKFLPGIVFSGIWLMLATPVQALVVNEFLPSPPSGSNEWVEFYNEQDDAEYIKGYFLDDDPDFVLDDGNQAKKPLTGLHIENVHYPYFEMVNFLNNAGDWVVLFDEQGSIIDQYEYTENPGAGKSIGRDPDKTGEFRLLESATKGAPNSEDSDPTVTPSPTDEPEPTAVPEPTIEPTPTTEPAEEEPTPTVTPIPTVNPEPEVTIFPIPTIRPIQRLEPVHLRPWRCSIWYKTVQYFGFRMRFPKLRCGFEW